MIEKHEFYEKQTYRNRCHINTFQGTAKLIIPLLHTPGKKGKTTINQIKIDYSQKWLTNHWGAIESAYRKAPFWEHYADDLHHQLFSRYPNLYDLNFNLLTISLNWLQLPLIVNETLSYENIPQSGITDLRNVINPKKPELLRKKITPSAYQQVFGKHFVENLSVIDLIFCEGPNARNILIASSCPD